MPFLDRTNELCSIIQSKLQSTNNKHFDALLKKKQQQQQQKSKTKNDATKNELQSRFYQHASTVSNELQKTADTLQQLTKRMYICIFFLVWKIKKKFEKTDHFFLLFSVVKKKTPFDDNVPQIQHLTATVKEQLARHEFLLREMNGLIRQQQQLSSSSSSTNNNNNSDSNNQQQQQQQQQQVTEHSNHIITGLNSRLMYTTQQFQNVLQTRTKQIMQQQERRNIFVTSNANHGGGGGGMGASSVSSSVSSTSSPLNHNKMTHSRNSPQSDNYTHNNNNNNTIVQIGGEIQPQQPQQQQQQQLETVIQVQKRNDQHLRMRSEEIRSIERDMKQLSEMFVELGQMVKMQGELAIRIDDKVSEAVLHVEEGQSELAKYLKRVSSNRGLVLKMFFVMVVFIIFIGVFVV